MASLEKALVQYNTFNRRSGVKWGVILIVKAGGC